MSEGVRVKICGVTRIDDALHAVAAGADLLGLNLWPGSKRYVEPARARILIDAVRATGSPVVVVGVFVDADEGAIVDHARALGLDVIQLHGGETPALIAALVARDLVVWRAVAMTGADALAAHAAPGLAAYLLDTPTAGHGGSGRTFDWTLAAAAVGAGHRVVLAGGLHPDNVAAAIAAAGPWAVDVASGVESAPGIKDPHRVTRFIAAARTAWADRAGAAADRHARG